MTDYAISGTISGWPAETDTVSGEYVFDGLWDSLSVSMSDGSFSGVISDIGGNNGLFWLVFYAEDVDGYQIAMSAFGPYVLSDEGDIVP